MVLIILSSKADTLAGTASGAAFSDEATGARSRDDPSVWVMGGAEGAPDALCEAGDVDWRVSELDAWAVAMSSSLDVAASNLRNVL